MVRRRESAVSNHEAEIDRMVPKSGDRFSDQTMRRYKGTS